MRAIHFGRAAAAVTVVAVALTLAGTALASNCTTVSGTFAGATYYPPPCLSPIGVCLRLTLSGSFLQTEDFMFTTLVNAGDASDPTRYEYAGSSVVSDGRDRTLYGQDTGAMHISPVELAPFVTTIDITGGTRQYSHASGQLLFTGNLNLSTGLASGTYDGTVCKSGDDEDE